MNAEKIEEIMFWVAMSMLLVGAGYAGANIGRHYARVDAALVDAGRFVADPVNGKTHFEFGCQHD